MNVETLPLDQVRPYWRNPRKIPDHAVAKVAESIATYGYQAPIIVDTEHVIIAGHTRYQALRRLGATEAAVVVSDLPPAAAREYRLADNRTSELTGWDTDALIRELLEAAPRFGSTWFPEVKIALPDIAAVTQNAIDAAQAAVTAPRTTPETSELPVTCPNCYHQFAVTLTAPRP